MTLEDLTKEREQNSKLLASFSLGFMCASFRAYTDGLTEFEENAINNLYRYILGNAGAYFKEMDDD